MEHHKQVWRIQDQTMGTRNSNLGTLVMFTDTRRRDKRERRGLKTKIVRVSIVIGMSRDSAVVTFVVLQ